MSYVKALLVTGLISSLLVNCPTSPEFKIKNGEHIATIEAPGFGGHLFWPRNDELIFVGDSGFFSISPSSGEVQQILASEKIPFSPLLGNRNIAFAEMVISGGTHEIYYLADERETAFRYHKGGLYKLDIGTSTPKKLIDNVTHAQVSGDSSMIAYVRSGEERLNDSLFVYDTKTQESHYLMQGLPLKFSRDNESLLIDAPEEQFQLSIFDLSSGENTPLNFSNSYLWQQKELAIRWDQPFPDLVFAEDREESGETGSSIKKWDGKTQKTEQIWNLPSKESFGLTLPIAWSVDRSHIAKWTDRCYDGLLGNCGQRRFSLHLIQNPSGSAQAVAKTASSPVAMAFSPDGSKLGYVNLESGSSGKKASVYFITTQ